jgi:hypothetical protein
MYIKLHIAVLLLLLSSGAFATDYYSNNEYTFSSTYNENYIYKWSASAGSNQESDNSVFAWMAPEVTSPTEVTISVLVTDVSCGCQSTDTKIISVLPNENIKLKTESISNSTNSTESDDVKESIPISANLTQNETSPIPEGNDAELNSASEENLTIQENLVNDTEMDANVPESRIESDLAPNSHDNGTTTGLQPIVDTNANQMTDEVDLTKTEENPPAVESAIEPAEQENQNTIIEISTLSFGDGTKVDVAFVEGSLESSTTFAKLHEDNTEWNDIISGTADSNNADSILDPTSTYNTTINQTEGLINPVKAAEAMPNSELNDHSNEVASEYSVKEDPSSPTESVVTPAEMIADATVSDAVERSTSQPLPAESMSDPEQETPAVESSSYKSRQYNVD